MQGKKPLNIAIGRRIQQSREQAGLTQEELAEQKSSADELENVCKSILQSAGEAG